MVRRNSAADVFSKLDMHDGDKDACWEWLAGLPRSGRPFFDLNGKKLSAYRLVYELVIGPIPDGMMLLHSCDNKVCCNPYHLTPGTHERNMEEMRTRERHGLPHHTVRAIRKLHEVDPSLTHEQIADRFGVSRRLVTDILNRVLYDHVEES